MTGTSLPPAATRLRVGALTVGGAVLAAVLLWTVAQVLGIELRVDPRNGQAPSAVGLPLTVTFTLAVSLLGWGTRALLGRFTRSAPVVWTILAGLVLLVSFLPLIVFEASGPAKTILALMHIAVAAVLISTFGRRKS
ncbi:DUF6069 family protein [Catellatospora citrea]|uniref:Uncharacterized protein n=1 Tax=Catellatospora citrea TaxID=53366 RepID=A0A8J3KMR1_9ACTN|nr:DUF6069 family protein [Catellatospora citrea]RKE05399.1 hypothetical protein C8E86_0194 [Catellatospora citrea]GIG00069.1 hypothetical protein Cci01nite_51620 [Catellatospora citrea]